MTLRGASSPEESSKILSSPLRGRQRGGFHSLLPFQGRQGGVSSSSIVP